METIEQRIARLEDEIRQLTEELCEAFNTRDFDGFYLTKPKLRAAMDEKERMEFDLKAARMFMASRNLTSIHLN